MKNHIWTLIGLDQDAVGFIEGGNVGSLAQAVKGPGDRVVPQSGTEAALLRRTKDLVVSKKIDHRDRQGLFRTFKADVCGGLAILTAQPLTQSRCYLKEETARCDDRKIGICEGGVGIRRGGGKSVGIALVLVRGINGVAEGGGLEGVCGVGVGREDMLELAEGWGWGGDSLSGRWGECLEAGKGTSCQGGTSSSVLHKKIIFEPNSRSCTGCSN